MRELGDWSWEMGVGVIDQMQSVSKSVSNMIFGGI